MIAEWACITFAAYTGGLGFVLGRLSPKRQLTPEEINRIMGRVVNMEAMEEHEKLNKVRMARNNVKSTRVDSGPPARITKMRVHRRGRRG